MSDLYEGDFHAYRHRDTNYAAETILNIALEALPGVNASVDVGCGVGTWLSSIQSKGAQTILGLDGPWVTEDLLEIPADSFTVWDLNEKINIETRFDLAMSFEVAEHLSPSSASHIVASLTNFADFIIFSAATPYQGGVGHVNEQWPDYWIKLFEQQGFVALDLIRRRIWQDTKIPVHYRKNILVYVRKERLKDLNLAADIEMYTPPEQYLLYYKKLVEPGIKQSINALTNAIKVRLGAAE